MAIATAVLSLAFASAGSAQEYPQREARLVESRTWNRGRVARAGGWQASEALAPQRQSVSSSLTGQTPSWYELERTSVSFGEMEIGQDSVVTGALVLRVFSDVDWSLKLVPSAQLEVSEGARAVPISRLSWRAQGAGTFLPFASSGAITVVEGARTSGAGRLVEVDLRLELEDSDPAGLYDCRLQLHLEQR